MPGGRSAVLADVMLKMGTYGFVRIAMPMLPDTLAAMPGGLHRRRRRLGALRRARRTRADQLQAQQFAYTSVSHMGYILLAVGAAGVLAGTDAQARTVAVSGAVTQMVSHGLITSTLFLLAGVLLDQGGSYTGWPTSAGWRSRCPVSRR